LAFIKALYGEGNCRVKLGHKLSTPFKILTGLKQGCPAACILFNVFFAIIIEVIKNMLETKGITLKFRLDGDIFNLKRLYAKTKIQKTSLLELLFADDAAVCATSESEMSEVIHSFYHVFSLFGLTMALKKTEIMFQKALSNLNAPDPKVEVNGYELKVVKKFKYLGGQLAENAKLDEEINFRIQRASANFSRLYQRVWKKRHLTIKLKAQIYRTTVVPALTYGCETWVWTSGQMAKLEGAQYRFLRSIAGKTWKDKIPYIHLISNLGDYNRNFDWANETNKGAALTAVETYCRLARLRYAGHVERMPDDRIPKMIMHGEIDMGQRKPGRPYKSYKQSLKDDLMCFDLWEKYQNAGQSFQVLASDREMWRRLINRQAQVFQLNWQKKKNERSQARLSKAFSNS
jgi:hypothetical protein